MRISLAYFHFSLSSCYVNFLLFLHICLFLSFCLASVIADMTLEASTAEPIAVAASDAVTSVPAVAQGESIIISYVAHFNQWFFTCLPKIEKQNEFDGH